MQSPLHGATSIQPLIVLSTSINTSFMIGASWNTPISIIEIQGTHKQWIMELLNQ
jgi:translation initiation factor 1 (eIF-1/SUI1)